MNEVGFVIQQRPYPPEWIFALDTPNFAPAPELWRWIKTIFLNPEHKLFNPDHAHLLAPMNERSRDLFDTIANTVIPLDPTIRPSAIKTFLDYVMGNDAALTAYLGNQPISLAEEVLRRWIKADMAQIQAVASNTAKVVSGASSLNYVASLQVGQTITLDSPLMLAASNTDVVIKMENAKGLGIDLEKLNAGQGVLFEIGISFEVVSITTEKGQLVYTLKALVN
ncbi:hypothetical protein QLH32_02385 [Acinetobacter corruptisaponis]|uniref:Phage tail protein n=1 Tax=Acinetobacter corruptisaponis TaxID=3045147 RepID=A0ABY8S765_9GAMM|nr:hypothetical protein [Acinetobacter sp. KCTC 92772]WHP06337.1 hypothetical protein QLH32_02385 [Acinetobacter sp. KCTC 92772]